jgi:hypothetical protein
VKPKLSPAQIRVLRELGKEGAMAHYMRYMGSFQPYPYWFVGDLHIRIETMNRLISLELVLEKKDSIGYPDKGVITAAGRDYLAALDKEA